MSLLQDLPDPVERGAQPGVDGRGVALRHRVVLTAEAEVGQTYLGTVSRIVEFGAFVEIFPGTDGLLHISEIADRRVKDVRDELKEGQQIMVKCIGREGNKIKLSRKAVLRDENRKAEAANAGEGE